MQPPTDDLLTAGTRLGANGEWQRTLALLAGLLLPFYVLDGSSGLKTMLLPAIGASTLSWLLTLRVEGGEENRAWRTVLLCFVVSYVTSLVASVVAGHRIPLNAVYPLLFVVLCLCEPASVRPFVFGLSVGLVGMALFGWYRFVTGAGGVADEHALGYWGIKYTGSTRNSDALVPLLLSGMAVSQICRARAGAVRAIWVAALVIGFSALTLTYARSAWVAMVCFLLLYSLSDWRGLLKVGLAVLLAGLAMLVVVRLAAPEVIAATGDVGALLERLRSIYDPSVQSSNGERLRLLTYAAEVGLRYPFAGGGIGQFDCCMEALDFPDLVRMRHPENLFMHLFSEFGVVSSLSALAIVAIACARGLRADSTEQRLAGAALAGLIVWLQMNSELSSLFVWVLLGVATSVAWHRPRSA